MSKGNGMGLLKHSNVYWEFVGQCTQCGTCTEACTSLSSTEMTLGEIARTLLNSEWGIGSREELAERIVNNTHLVQAIRGCFFCTSCKNTCFAHNDVCKLIYHARVDFQDLGLIPREAWSSIQVDREWDIFTAYRAIYGISFTDLTRHVDAEKNDAPVNFDLAFFPGCSMAAYAPELTREIFASLEELSGEVTMIDHCCGSSLKSAGFYDRAEALLNRVADELESSGVRQVVCVCPGCINDIESTIMRRGLDIATVSLSAFLTEHGFAPKRALPETQLCLSKSCQDRDASYLEETCALLRIDPQAPAVFKGCCGAGGAVSAYDPDCQSQQAESKLSLVPDGSTVVTMCPTCTYTYAYHLLSNPRDVTNKHYTELLFEKQFDWERVFPQLGGMWSGEYGAWLAQIFE